MKTPITKKVFMKICELDKKSNQSYEKYKWILWEQVLDDLIPDYTNLLCEVFKTKYFYFDFNNQKWWIENDYKKNPKKFSKCREMEDWILTELSDWNYNELWCDLCKYYEENNKNLNDKKN